MATLTSCNNSDDDDDDGQRVLKNVHIIFANDEQLVEAILDKDEQLNREVDKRFDLESFWEFSFDEDEASDENA